LFFLCEKKTLRNKNIKTKEAQDYRVTMVTRRVTILCEAQACRRFALDHHPSGDYGFPSGNDQGNPKGYIQGN